MPKHKGYASDDTQSEEDELDRLSNRSSLQDDRDRRNDGDDGDSADMSDGGAPMNAQQRYVDPGGLIERAYTG